MPRHAESTDRRRHVRRPCRLSVQAPDGAPARTTDVSEGGARLQRLDGRALRVGQRLALELCLPDGPLRAAAEVVAVHGVGPCSTGAVRFAALDPENVRRLRALTSRPAPLPPGARPLARLPLARLPRA